MQESPIFSKTYDYLTWIIPQAAKFPRVHRFGLAERLVRRGLDFQESLLAAGAKRGPGRLAFLEQADLQLGQIKLLLRLCKDLGAIDLRQYEHGARLLVEIGRLLGGWQKTCSAEGQADGRAGGARRLVEQQS